MHLTIGRLAKAAEVKISTIRYYERSGLLEKPTCSDAGYRLYAPDAVERIRFIKNAQALGFTLDEINDLLVLQAASLTANDYRCQRVKQQAAHKLNLVDDKIHTLKRIRRALKQLYDQCDASRSITECPILQAITEKKPSKVTHGKG